jgi:hypothetical protein
MKELSDSIIFCPLPVNILQKNNSCRNIIVVTRSIKKIVVLNN